MLHSNHDERRLNFTFLQAVADSIGREFEAKPYDELVQPAGKVSFKRVIDGVEVNVSAEAKPRGRDGTLRVCVDVRATLPTPFGAQPFYVFRKRRDGTVLY